MAVYPYVQELKGSMFYPLYLSFKKSSLLLIIGSLEVPTSLAGSHVGGSVKLQLSHSYN